MIWNQNHSSKNLFEIVIWLHRWLYCRCNGRSAKKSCCLRAVAVLHWWAATSCRDVEIGSWHHWRHHWCRYCLFRLFAHEIVSILVIVKLVAIFIRYDILWSAIINGYKKLVSLDIELRLAKHRTSVYFCHTMLCISVICASCTARPSPSCIMLKRVTIASNFFHSRVATPF